MSKIAIQEEVILKGKKNIICLNENKKHLPFKILEGKYFKMIKNDFGDITYYMFIDEVGVYIPDYQFVDIKDKTENEYGLQRVYQYYLKDYFYTKEELRKEKIKKLLS